MTTEYTKPVPIPGGLHGTTLGDFTKPFWEATKRHELVIQRCRQHDGFFFYPRELCPVCLSDDLEWAPVSGRGRVHAFTIVYQHPTTHDSTTKRRMSTRSSSSTRARG